MVFRLNMIHQGRGPRGSQGGLQETTFVIMSSSRFIQDATFRERILVWLLGHIFFKVSRRPVDVCKISSLRIARTCTRWRSALPQRFRAGTPPSARMVRPHCPRWPPLLFQSRPKRRTWIPARHPDRPGSRPKRRTWMSVRHPERPGPG